MKITFNNYMNGFNNTIYSNNMKKAHNINKQVKEIVNEPKTSTVKNSTNNNVVHENIVNSEINLENNMLYYYRSQELKRKKVEPKEEEKITKIPEL